jgi:hypothetical protein
MTGRTRIALALGTLLLLAGCLVAPGRFASTLDIRADRTFTFTYQGEVIALDPDKAMKSEGISSDSGMDDGDNAFDEQDAAFQQIAYAGQNGKGGSGKGAGNAPPDRGKDAAPDFSDAQRDDRGKDDEAKMQAIAEALLKEKGFRAARYVGNHKFEIDYAIAGTLDHGFVFPFNTDAELVFPFIAIELRGDDRVRVKAPGYANEESRGRGGMGGMGGGKTDVASQLDGSFTLTSAAPIISQNQEDGPKRLPDGRQQLVWKVNSLTTQAPMAVIRFGK